MPDERDALGYSPADAPRAIEQRSLGSNPRCTCASPDPFSDQVPAMKHPLHLGRVCGVRLADGTACQCAYTAP